MNGHYYVLQQEWSNVIVGCTQGRTPFAQWNDSFASAEEMDTGSVTAYASNSLAGKEAGEPTPEGNVGGHSIWYRYTPSEDENVTIDTCGSTFDTILGVYTGDDVSTLSSAAENDNGCGVQSSISLAVTAGTTYSIEVDGANGATGTVALALQTAHGISVGDAAVLEGDSGSRTIKFPVTLTQPATSTVTVHYAVTGVDATGATKAGPDVDFKARSGTLTFKPSLKTGNTPVVLYVAVTVYGDTSVEPDEQFHVTLTNPSNGSSLGRKEGTGTILNDDVGSGISLGIGDASIVEGDSGTGRKLSFPVTLSSPSPSAVSVHYAVTGVNATYGKTASSVADFAGKTSGTISFKLLASGKTAVVMTISIPIWADTRRAGRNPHHHPEHAVRPGHRHQSRRHRNDTQRRLTGHLAAIGPWAGLGDAGESLDTIRCLGEGRFGYGVSRGATCGDHAGSFDSRATGGMCAVTRWH